MPVIKKEDMTPHGRPPSAYQIKAPRVTLGGQELFPELPEDDLGQIHELMDEAWALSEEQGRSARFADEPFPVRIAEKLRTTIMGSAVRMGGEFGSLMAEAAQRGYWLQGPSGELGASGSGNTWFCIWRIDCCHELCGCKPIAFARTLREAALWISAAPLHECAGGFETAHEEIRYKAARKRCLAVGGEWRWPLSHKIDHDPSARKLRSSARR